MSKRTLPAALVIASSLTLAGCSVPALPGGAAPASTAPSASASAPASASASSAAPDVVPASSTAASGRALKGDGYRFTPPKGWRVPKGVSVPKGPDTYAADLADRDGFADNVNVIVVRTGAVPAEQAEQQGVQGLKAIGARGVKVRNRVTVAGERTAHLTALSSSSGARYRVDQFYVPHRGRTYVVTFSFSPSVSKSHRDALTRSVLRTWAWA